METTVHTDKLCRFKRYFLFFSLFGQNIFRPENVFSYIPSILSLVLIILCKFRLTAKEFKDIDFEHKFVLYSLVVLNMLPILIAVLESFRMPKGTQYFMKIFDTIIEYLETKTSTKINWTKFQRRIALRFKMIFFCYIITALFRLSFRTPMHGRRYELWSTALRFYRTTTLLHIMFYVDLLNFLLSSVTSSVKAPTEALQEKQCFESKDVIKILKLVKLHHFQVWECFQVINEYFGRIFVAITLDSVYTILNTGYWTFYLWMSGQSTFVLLRK